MYQIDKTRFGTFVAGLRKERGMTQRELAEKLYISDKAVSKWETGVSIPDTGLLIPLAENLGVTVTELLLCQRTDRTAPMEAGQVEQVVKTAIRYGEDKLPRAWQTRNVWQIIFPCALLVGVLCCVFAGQKGILGEEMVTAVAVGAVFGGYFCFFVKTRLPGWYDEHRLGLYYDGIFRMNVPGVTFNNSNWPKIVTVCRLSSCASVALIPMLGVVMGLAAPELWRQYGTAIFLVLFLGGLFAPVWVLGRKYS